MFRKDLTTFFNPKSVAVIGASRNFAKLGSIILKNIVESGFKGELFPINPSATEILGIKCFATYDDIEVVPDLAIISLPSNIVNPILEKIGEKGTKNVVVLSAGYKEIGEEGVKLDEELKEISSRYNINLLGPNCLGFVNNFANLNATFGNKVSKVGNLKVLSQSGAIASSMMDYAEEMHLGFSQFVTLGNKSVLTEIDFLDYWLKNDEQIPHDKEPLMDKERISNFTPIGVYLESISDGYDLINTLSQLTMSSPVFMLKPGKSESAQKAMQSHTGSMAGSDKVLTEALKEVGAIRCDGIEELFDLAKAFAWENAPDGSTLAIVSNAGGPAVATTDFIESAGLQLAEFDEEFKKKFYEYLPRTASVVNPIDVLGDALAPRYGYALDLVLAQNHVNSVLVILTPQVMTEIHETAEVIARMSAVHKKPIFCSFMGGKFIHKGEEVLNKYKIPNFRFPERAVNAIGKMWWWKSYTIHKIDDFRSIDSKITDGSMEDGAKSVVARVLDIPKQQSRSTLNSYETNEVLRECGFTVPESEPVYTIDEAKAFAVQYGYPVVLKIISSTLLHKSDLGGVIVGIQNDEELEVGFNQLKEKMETLSEEAKKDISIQIQKQIPKGVEVILGVKKDQDFGHVIMFGAGGVNAEIIQDSVLKLVPCTKTEARQFVEKSKIYRILKGFRGEDPYAVDKLVEDVEKMSNLAINFPEIQEFEVNPIIVTHTDSWAVDGKGVLIS